ncbi:helix-turn-helix domain-containing protein [Gimesia chilikensis]|uniref:helix-turn-helix domain-containing protein n=1 Tax=Gimesia chilikensis TaxID=2605989 RepID=UPI0011F089D4|nr:helix-turn-helix domain-containing protein [Gimesia chilikensis]KAA0134462.1 helix-turn-helix domain-containing protein [Gimesia chilikensis]
MANPSSSDLLSIEEVSDIISLSISTIRRRIRDGSIPAIQPGGKGTKLLIPKEWINQQATTPQSSRLEPSSSGRHQRKSISGPPPRWKK